MNYDPVGLIISMGISFVASKFPIEFRDKSKRFVIFEMCEIVCDELTNKNFNIMWESCYSDLVDIKDINLGIKN